ncbi:ATP-dependent zinc protease family protein [Lysobacter panacisoli]|uniref:ATP-dependent zinc protease n=1 Tax=Lysobacter panacisoli TaxID=1255263 RepID=A0ABP9LKM1_9GAMM|nr:RimK/LysX family protein [Lysobacter panacisoli]
MATKIVLGWREWVALPDLGIGRLRAKIDSGARSSALHVDAQWHFHEGGAPWVGFRLSPGHGAGVIEGAAPVFDVREVTDSGGHCTRRVFVRTTLSLAGLDREIEINLSDRRGMLFPMLLGRTALARQFTVDPARSFLHGRLPTGAARVHALKTYR